MVNVKVEKSNIEMELSGSLRDLVAELGAIIGHFLDQTTKGHPEHRERLKTLILNMINECL